jgi:hypothetical protein
MESRITADKVKREIYERIKRERERTKNADLRSMIFEKPWCTGGKGEEVALIRLRRRDPNSK